MTKRRLPISTLVERVLNELLPLEKDDRMILSGLVVLSLMISTIFAIVWLSLELNPAVIPGFYLIAIISGILVYKLMNTFVERSVNSLMGRGREVNQITLRFEDTLDRARGAEREQDFPQAVELYRDILRQELTGCPDWIWNKIALLYDHQMHDYIRAVQAYRRLVSQLRERENKAGTLEENDQQTLERSLKRLEELVVKVEEQQRGAHARRREIMGLIDGEQLEEARSRVDQMCEEEPDDDESLYLKGYVLCHLNQHDFGIDFYRLALEQNPGHHRARFNMASALDIMERDVEALKAYEEYLELALDDPEEEEWLVHAKYQMTRLKSEIEGEFLHSPKKD